MKRGILIDTGPLVAILHRGDRDHELCVDTLKHLREPLLTTWMPVTEAMYLLEFSPKARDALLQMIERKAVQVLPLEREDMPMLRALMSKYSDLPMDFADATLVHMANRQSIGQIFTLDRRDFSIYRLKGGRSFTVIPTI